MHALVVTVNVEPGREDEGVEFLQTNVLPGMKQIPGLVSGYWLATRDGQGLTVLLFENEEAAQAAAAGLPNASRADFATLGTVELREVVAQI
jgi:hypothetical protein